MKTAYLTLAGSVGAWAAKKYQAMTSLADVLAGGNKARVATRTSPLRSIAVPLAASGQLVAQAASRAGPALMDGDEVRAFEVTKVMLPEKVKST